MSNHCRNMGPGRYRSKDLGYVMNLRWNYPSSYIVEVTFINTNKDITELTRNRDD